TREGRRQGKDGDKGRTATREGRRRCGGDGRQRPTGRPYAGYDTSSVCDGHVAGSFHLTIDARGSAFWGIRTGPTPQPPRPQSVHIMDSLAAFQAWASGRPRRELG